MIAELDRAKDPVVLMVDDVPLMQDLMCAALKANGLTDITVAETLAKAQTAIKKIRPQVVLLNLHMQHERGSHVLDALRCNDRKQRVIIYSLCPDDAVLFHLAMTKGAEMLIVRENSLQDLVRAIRSAGAGCPFINTVTKRRLCTDWKDDHRPSIQTLSAREHQVFVLLGSGYANKEIAQKLGCRPKTIDSFKCRIQNKICTSNMCETKRAAIVYTQHWGDASLEPAPLGLVGETPHAFVGDFPSSQS